MIRCIFSCRPKIIAPVVHDNCSDFPFPDIDEDFIANIKARLCEWLWSGFRKFPIKYAL